MDEKEFEGQLQALSERVLSKALSSEEETNYTESLFESIRHVNEYGEEFWYARELQIALEYKEWRNFLKVIEKAKTACNGSENEVSDHFVEVNKMVNIGSGAERELEDMELSRYACYLIVQNGDSRKKVIALGQSYFAVKTRQQELIDNFDKLDEDKKRLAIRREMIEHSQKPRRKQRGIKLESPQGAGYLTLAAVAKCLRAVTWLVARGNKKGIAILIGLCADRYQFGHGVTCRIVFRFTVRKDFPHINLPIFVFDPSRKIVCKSIRP